MTSHPRPGDARQGEWLGQWPLWGYELVLMLLAICLAPVAFLLLVRREWRVGIGERLGRIPETPPGQPALWIHAASVGEVAALAPLVGALRAEFPEHRLVVSTLTRTGRAFATTHLPEVDACVFFPLDVRCCTARAIDAVRPRLVLFSETELWPGFLAALARRGVPAAMVSGRMSARGFIRYRRWQRLFAATLATVRWFAVQSMDTARRLVALGAPKSRVVVTGSLKTARVAPPSDGPTLVGLGVGGCAVVVAGSTHAGEEAAVLDAWEHLTPPASQARLVLAPRHPERFDEVATLLRQRGFRFARRSELGGVSWPAETAILLLDTLGELCGLYEGARMAFVGGTLTSVGGHNLIEPALCGVPVVFGPHVENVRGEAERLRASGGGLPVADAAELGRVIGELIADPVRARRLGEAARAAVPESRGPLVVTLALVRSLLASGAPVPVPGSPPT